MFLFGMHRSLLSALEHAETACSSLAS